MIMRQFMGSETRVTSEGSWLKAGGLVLLLAIAGCTNQNKGTVAGGVVGGIVGSQVGQGGGRTAATAAGVVLGSLIGGEIGKTMDDVDRMSVQNAIESGRPQRWHNKQGYIYRVDPRDIYTRHGRRCRDFVTVVRNPRTGWHRTYEGTACRVRDGYWETL